MTLQEMKEDYDWKEAFAYADKPQPTAGFAGSTGAVTMADVEEILAYDNGENDGAEWIGVFKLKDGRFFYLAAGCDYTGWDCQASGSSWVADSFDSLFRYGLTEDSRSRLRSQLKNEGAE